MKKNKNILCNSELIIFTQCVPRLKNGKKTAKMSIFRELPRYQELFTCTEKIGILYREKIHTPLFFEFMDLNDEDIGWEEVVYPVDEPDFGLDETAIDTTDGSFEAKPSYPSTMKFEGFDMSKFFLLTI